MNSLIFWGTPAFSAPSLNQLAKQGLVCAVVTRPDSQQGRGRALQASAVKKAALDLGLPVITPAKLDDSFLASLQPYLPATFLVIAYGKIIPDTVLRLSQLPALNIHPSRLPFYRGASPIQSVLLNGESETAVTLMQLDAQMDHGPIVAQRIVPIDSGDYYRDLEQRLAQIAAQILMEKMPSYLSGAVAVQEQNHANATICKKISKQDGEIKWDQPAEKIRNKIRAFTPWPGAYFFWNHQRFIISRADPAENPEHRPAGTWWQAANRLLVACGSEALAVDEIQPEGKNKMTAQEFLNGYAQKILNSEKNQASNSNNQ